MSHTAFELRSRNSAIDAIARNQKAFVRRGQRPVSRLTERAGPGETPFDLSERVKRSLGIAAPQLAFDLPLDIALVCQVREAVHSVVLGGGLVAAIAFAK